MRDIEELHGYLSSLKELKKAEAEVGEKLTPIQVLTLVKGYMKVEMGQIDVYCRPAGMGSHRKNSGNAKAGEIRSDRWRIHHRKVKTNTSSNLGKLYEMTEDDWAEAIDLANRERRQLKKQEVKDQKARREKVRQLREVRAKALNEKRDTQQTKPIPSYMIAQQKVKRKEELKNRRPIIERKVRDEATCITLHKVKAPFSVVGTTVSR
jgi:hypothetical protein